MNTVIFEVERLKKEAQALRDILMQYRNQEPEAELCLNELDPIIQKVLRGEVTNQFLQMKFLAAIIFRKAV